MTFEELGVMLRSEREKRNLRLEDAADKLKINPRQLRALEDGDLNALPHAAYARGFIRSYATWLGLGADEIQEALGSLNSVPTRPLVKRQDNGQLEMSGKPEPASRKGLITLAILLCCAACAWWLWQSGKLDWAAQLFSSSKQMDQPLQTADNYLAEKDAQNASATSVDSSGQKSDEIGKNVSSTYVLPVPGNATPDFPARNATISPKPQAPLTAEDHAAEIPLAAATEIAAAGEAANPSQPDNHKLVITAVEECWIHSNADKTDTRQFSLRKGDTFALTFTKSLELKLGNAGGVRLRYDGNDLPPPGTSGQVKTIVFPPKENS